jgi:hypothetical protein
MDILIIEALSARGESPNEICELKKPRHWDTLEAPTWRVVPIAHMVQTDEPL